MLIKQNEMNVTNVPNIVVACRILYNMCEIHGEEFDNDWLVESQQQSQGFLQPTPLLHPGSETDPGKIREKLVDFLSQ